MPTQRPNRVRIHSKSKKKPPTAIIPGDDLARPSQTAAGTNREVTVKYIDPSYMVRSVPADAGDSYLCMLLAHAAAHGAMAGYTGFTVGLVKNKSVMIPIPELARTSPRSMNARGRTWERVVAVTNQPCAVARKEVAWAAGQHRQMTNKAAGP